MAKSKKKRRARKQNVRVKSVEDRLLWKLVGVLLLALGLKTVRKLLDWPISEWNWSWLDETAAVVEDGVKIVKEKVRGGAAGVRALPRDAGRMAAARDDDVGRVPASYAA